MFLKVTKDTLLNLDNVVSICVSWDEAFQGEISFLGVNGKAIKSITIEDKCVFDKYVENNINPLLSSIKSVD